MQARAVRLGFGLAEASAGQPADASAGGAR